jgi:hypothetical protein
MGVRRHTKAITREMVNWSPLPAGTNQVVAVGINRVFAAFALNKILVFEDLHGLLDELQSYSYELDDMGEPTEKIESKESFHILDSVRYILGYLNTDRPVHVGPVSTVARPGMRNF